MLIGQLAEITGFTKDTIRYYEKFGLLKKQIKRNPNNYKDYTEEAVTILNYVKLGKKYGFTLNEIKELIKISKNNNAMCEVLKLRAIKKMDDINQEIKRLTNLKKQLRTGLKELDRCVNINSK